MSTNLFTISQLAEQHGVESYQIYDVCKLRGITPTAKIGRAWVFDPPTAALVSAAYVAHVGNKGGTVCLYTLDELSSLHTSLPVPVIRHILKTKLTPPFYGNAGEPLYDERAGAILKKAIFDANGDSGAIIKQVNYEIGLDAEKGSR